MLIAAACLPMLAACGTPAPILVRPPAPPPWAMQACPDWPQLPGEGRVELAELAGAIVDAKVAHADCDAKHEALRRYITDVVRPQ